MSLSELVTFKVTKEIKEKMQKFDNVNWSAFLRAHIVQKIKELERIEKESEVNFCPTCGKRVSTPDDQFCRFCGNSVNP